MFKLSLIIRLAILPICYFPKVPCVQAVETPIRVINRNRVERSRAASESDDIVDTTDVQEYYFQQRLDHFASHPSIHQRDFVFSQRYFYSSRYIAPNNKIERRAYLRSKEETRQTFAFLCVGGEGPSLTKNVLVNSVHCSGDMLELASKMNKDLNVDVHLFALEHRYYGESYPKFADGSSPISNSNLVYLSSRQALADIANFIQFARGEYQIGEEVKWITFGGSYPGMMAAWARLKYPHLVYAAVSNSAPVQVVLDFPQYNSVVAASLENEMVGGSKECLNIVRDGHDQIASTLAEETNEARQKIGSMFNICGGAKPLAVQKNVNAFLGDGVVYIPAQENDPSCKGDLCNIEKICNYLTSSPASSPMEKLAEMSKKVSDECVDIDWEKMISFLSSDAAEVDGTRSWLWQTCTEMGFYQTCELNSTCPYGKGFHTVDQDLEICERAFGIDAELVPKNVEDTLIDYGGWHMGGSRILSVNGDIDPWSALSMNEGGANSTDMPTYWSLGASHHFWTHEVKESDGDIIKATREMIHKWVIDVSYSKSDGEQVVDYTSTSRA